MSAVEQAQAKKFFVDRVISQATSEGLRLSEAEKRMLSWSESDPFYEPDPQVVEKLESEMSDEEYEAKISGLIKRAYDADIVAIPSSRDRYKEAYRQLKEGDHYILIMIEDAIGRHVKRWGLF